MRADGKLLKNVDPMYKIAAFVMNKRIDAMNSITINIPLGPIQHYINLKRGKGIYISHMAVVIAAYLRVTAEFPMLNRFIVNCKPYARNEFCVGMVVLKAGQVDHGTMSKMYFKLDNTIFDVNNTINKYVEENRNSPEKNGTERFIRILLKIPGILRIAVALVKFLDKHGMLPKKVIDMSPFHCSMSISNLASIRTNHIMHHVYEFGTTSVFMTMGKSVEIPKRKEESIIHDKCMPIGIVMDERICSGAYFALAFKRFKRYIKNPELLELPPEVVNQDPELEVKKTK